ncbi:hypothetical protein [Flavihumibacter fluvii]|uniref:hypothetical protein n=1 Tax=Flavihumibacter fluvii TaxID=2838157 RepID=UPI001BDE8603|nr:hypothetical protein [Flavihumibacter fluvii]ULQ51708.1 hypothetical protein KJS93_16595 [Flavihumibacter fluvii]
MALYWITIEQADDKTLSGAKEIASEYIDFVYQHIYHLAVLRIRVDQAIANV